MIYYHMSHDWGCLLFLSKQWKYEIKKKRPEKKNLCLSIINDFGTEKNIKPYAILYIYIYEFVSSSKLR